MYSWLPPLFTGKVPTTRPRMMLAGVAMAAAELPAFLAVLFAAFAFYALHLLAVVALLLLCPRLWVAVLALASASAYAWQAYVAPGTYSPAGAAMQLGPVWLGTLIAYRPRIRRAAKR